jgi:hypothetical protein
MEDRKLGWEELTSHVSDTPTSLAASSSSGSGGSNAHTRCRNHIPLRHRLGLVKTSQLETENTDAGVGGTRTCLDLVA